MRSPTDSTAMKAMLVSVSEHGCDTQKSLLSTEVVVSAMIFHSKFFPHRSLLKIHPDLLMNCKTIFFAPEVQP